MRKKMFTFFLIFVMIASSISTAAAAENMVLEPPQNIRIVVNGTDDLPRPQQMTLNFDVPESIQKLSLNSKYYTGYAIEYKVNNEPWQHHNEDWQRKVDTTLYFGESSFLYSEEIGGKSQITVELPYWILCKFKELEKEYQEKADVLVMQDNDEFAQYFSSIDFYGFYKGYTYTFRIRFFAYKALLDQNPTFAANPIHELSPYSQEVTVTGLGTFTGTDTIGGSSQTPGAYWSKASDWAVPELLKAGESSRGLVPARLKGADLTAPVTRGEFAEIAMLLYGNIEGSSPVGTVEGNPFSDVDFITDYPILEAYTAGIVDGVGGGKFQPDARTNREQIATMLLRTVKAGTAGGENPSKESFETENPVSFSDAGRISGWATEGVNYFASKEIIKGSNGTFNPKGTCSRQEALLLSNRIFNIYSKWGDHFVE